MLNLCPGPISTPLTLTAPGRRRYGGGSESAAGLAATAGARADSVTESLLTSVNSTVLISGKLVYISTTLILPNFDLIFVI